MKRLVIATALVLAQICSAGLTNVYVGTGPDSGTGDPLRTAFMKLNTNDVYLEAYITSARASAYGTNFNAAATNWITTAIASGDSATATGIYGNLVSIISTNTVASAISAETSLSTVPQFQAGLSTGDPEYRWITKDYMTNVYAIPATDRFVGLEVWVEFEETNNKVMKLVGGIADANWVATNVLSYPLYESWPTMRSYAGDLYMTHGEGEAHANSTYTQVVLKKSTDGGKTWTRYPIGTVLTNCESRNHTFGITSSGRLVMIQSIVVSTGPATSVTNAAGRTYLGGGSFVYTSNRVWYSDSKGVTWNQAAGIPLVDSMAASSIPYGTIEEVNGRLITTMYSLGNVDGSGTVYQLLSVDNGLTWNTNSIISNESAGGFSPSETTIIPMADTLWLAIVRFEGSNWTASTTGEFDGSPAGQFITYDAGTNWTYQGLVRLPVSYSPDPMCLQTYESPGGRRLALFNGNRWNIRLEVYDAAATDIIASPANWQTAARTELGRISLVKGAGGYPTAARTDQSGGFIIGYYYDPAGYDLTNYSVVLVANYTPKTVSGRFIASTSKTIHSPVLQVQGFEETPRPLAETVPYYGASYFDTNSTFELQPGWFGGTGASTFWGQYNKIVTRGTTNAFGRNLWVDGFTMCDRTFVGGTSNPYDVGYLDPMFVFNGMHYRGPWSGSGLYTLEAFAANTPLFAVANDSTYKMTVYSDGSQTNAGALKATALYSGGTISTPTTLYSANIWTTNNGVIGGGLVLSNAVATGVSGLNGRLFCSNSVLYWETATNIVKVAGDVF